MVACLIVSDDAVGEEESKGRNTKTKAAVSLRA